MFGCLDQLPVSKGTADANQAAIKIEGLEERLSIQYMDVGKDSSLYSMYWLMYWRQLVTANMECDNVNRRLTEHEAHNDSVQRTWLKQFLAE